ncbi:MAG: hypothetical protein NWQ21_06400, partial [Desulfobacterales bacterium]|nr:hypothetical protein [Desulfobacterales bacterium]
MEKQNNLVQFSVECLKLHSHNLLKLSRFFIVPRLVPARDPRFNTKIEYNTEKGGHLRPDERLRKTAETR